MENNKFEKRMEFLKKSYERIPSTFDSEEVLQKIEEDTAKSGTDETSIRVKNRFKPNLIVWAVSIASVFLFGFITASFMFEQKNNPEEMTSKEVTVEDIEKLKEKYRVEREKRRETLKLEEDKFAKLEFIAYADKSIASSRRYAMFDNSQELLEKDFERALAYLKLPSEMIKDVVENPLVDDEQESIVFLASYRSKVRSLITVYDEVLAENREAVDAYDVDASVDKAEIMMLVSRNKFPEQLQNIISTMREQSIRLQTNSNSGEIGARYYEVSLQQELKTNLAPTMFAYIDMLVEEPYMYGATLQYPLDRTVSMVQSMEKTLMEVERDSTLYPVLESYFITIFNEVMKGSKDTQIFDEKGVLKNDYQQAWESFASSGDATPLAYVVKPIVEEMEASGWRQSAEYGKLSYDALKDALVLYREGQLEFYMYGKRPDFHDETMYLPDSTLENEVQMLYKTFKKSYDKSVFKGKSPIYVVGVFDYANEMDDPETMYHLFHENNNLYSESGIEWTPKRYVDNWRKGLSLFRDATQIEFNTEYIQRFEQTFSGSVGIVVDGEIRRSVNVIYDENERWAVSDVRMEPLPSYQEQPEMDIDEGLMDYVRYIYRPFSKTKDPIHLVGQEALTIAALYFYAGELGDYETQYALFFQGEGYPIVDKETYLQEAPSYFLPYSEAMYTKMSFKGQEQDENGNWRGIAKLTVDTKKFPDEKPVKDFQMVWTENGWRVLFMPMQ